MTIRIVERTRSGLALRGEDSLGTRYLLWVTIRSNEWELHRVRFRLDDREGKTS